MCTICLANIMGSIGQRSDLTRKKFLVGQERNLQKRKKVIIVTRTMKNNIIKPTSNFYGVENKRIFFIMGCEIQRWAKLIQKLTSLIVSSLLKKLAFQKFNAS